MNIVIRRTMYYIRKNEISDTIGWTCSGVVAATAPSFVVGVGAALCRRIDLHGGDHLAVVYVQHLLLGERSAARSGRR